MELSQEQITEIVEAAAKRAIITAVEKTVLAAYDWTEKEEEEIRRIARESMFHVERIGEGRGNP